MTSTCDYSVLLRTNLYVHQLRALDAMTGRRAYALAMEMGTGKSLTIVADVARLYAAGAIDSVLIVAPNGVHRNWHSEFQRHCAVPHRVFVRVVGGGTARTVNMACAAAQRRKSLTALTVNHHTFSGSTGLHDIETFLACAGRCYLAVDESDGFKNPRAIRTRNLLKCAPRFAYRRILTGTPVNNSPFDLWAQYCVLDKSVFSRTPNYRAFCARYAELLSADHHLCASVRRATGHIPQIVATDATGRKLWRNLDELSELIAPITFRVRKEECLDLPPKAYHTTYYDLSTEQKKAYKEARTHLAVQLRDETLPVSSKLALVSKLSQITSGFFTDQYSVPRNIVTPERNPKLIAAMQIIQRAVAEGRSIIVWCRFLHEAQLLADACLAEELPALQYHGSVSEQRRADVVAEFNGCGEPRVFIGTAAAGGTGLTLNAASVVLYFSNTYSLRDRLQSEDRCHRIGQVRSVTYYDLIAPDTIESRVLTALQNKGDVASAILTNL